VLHAGQHGLGRFQDETTPGDISLTRIRNFPPVHFGGLLRVHSSRQKARDQHHLCSAHLSAVADARRNRDRRAEAKGPLLLGRFALSFWASPPAWSPHSNGGPQTRFEIRLLGEKPTNGEDLMKQSTLAKITASVAAAKGMAQKALATSPDPQWTEQELQSIDGWITNQDLKMDRSEAIRRLVEIGLKAKK
jgi:hypothetical protein